MISTRLEQKYLKLAGHFRDDGAGIICATLDDALKRAEIVFDFPDDWLGDPVSRDIADAIIVLLLEAFRPPPSPVCAKAPESLPLPLRLGPNEQARRARHELAAIERLKRESAKKPTGRGARGAGHPARMEPDQLVNFLTNEFLRAVDIARDFRSRRPALGLPLP